MIETQQIKYFKPYKIFQEQNIFLFTKYYILNTNNKFIISRSEKVYFDIYKISLQI